MIERFKTSSAVWDDIKLNIIKLTYSDMLEPLYHIINTSFDKGHVPNQLKLATAIPIFKNGDDKYIPNYNPSMYCPFFQGFLKD